MLKMHEGKGEFYLGFKTTYSTGASLACERRRISACHLVPSDSRKYVCVRRLALLMSNGSTFQSFGAAQVKERSPSIAFDLKRG